MLKLPLAVEPPVVVPISEGWRRAQAERTPNAQPPRISVALCTRNGRRYLREQLESIARQFFLPTELVVCDDCSSDDTVAIVRRFAANAPFEVRLFENQRWLGTSANFGRAISLCRGEIIALCDQDDIWLPQKLHRLAEAFADPEVGFVLSDAVVVDSVRRPLGYRLWEAVRLSPSLRQRLESDEAARGLLKRNVATGAAMAFRATYRRCILPIPAAWMHDGWIALVLAAISRCRLVAEPLLEYRQHPEQQIGVAKKSLYEQYLIAREQDHTHFRRVARNFLAARRRLARLHTTLRDPGLEALLGEKIAHFCVRARMRESRRRRLSYVLGELWRGHYGRYSAGWKSLIQDLLL